MTTESAYNKPLPTITSLTRPYWEAAKNHELRLQRCDDCGHVWFPPSYCCPKCLGDHMTWTKMSGRAKLWSWIDIWQMYYRGFAEERPYIVAYVELEEGPRLMSTIVDVEGSDLCCDMPLEVTFDDVTDEVTLPKFRVIG